MNVGPPVTFHVLRRLWPEHHQEYMDFLAKNIGHDAVMHVGVLHGGQQFLDTVSTKKSLVGVPMGLLGLCTTATNYEKATPNRHRCAVPGNRGSARANVRNAGYRTFPRLQRPNGIGL